VRTSTARAGATLADALLATLATAAALLAGAPSAGALPASASSATAAPRVSLKMSFLPDRLAQSTTIRWSFAVSQPLPLRTLQLRLPAGMGFASTSLGIEECTPAALEAGGPESCPADSLLGHGEATAEVPAQTLVSERARVTALMGPAVGEGGSEALTVLFFVEGRAPVNREITITGQLTDLAGAQGAQLLTEVPPLPVWPDGPDIGLVRFDSTIGPRGLTYYRQVGGRRVAFAPRGLTVPDRCPRGGFRASVRLGWWGVAEGVTARARVACP
jgi:hypothetical protein